MKKCIFILISFLLTSFSNGQSIYESPLGFSLSFDKTWKRLPKEVVLQRMKDVAEFLNYKKEVQFDACFQKIGNADMDLPYILFKNVYATTTSEDEIAQIKKYFTNKAGFENVVQNIVNGLFDVEIEIGKNYYDAGKKILIFTYDMGISIKGNLVGMFAFYVGKNASLLIYCYSYKDEFKYDQKEFLDVIYTISDKGMTSSMSDYVSKHDIATKYYNDGKGQSSAGNRIEAVRLYTKAIENYPSEDRYAKSEAYYNRGLNNRYLNNIQEAINDYSEAIKLRPDYYKAYNNRGYAKLLKEDFAGAIPDFTMTIKYDNYNTEFTNMALGNRGIAKIYIGQDGCPDLKKAIESGNKNVIDFYNQNCK